MFTENEFPLLTTIIYRLHHLLVGSYLKREKPQETPTTRRKAVNEKQMAKDDLKALFAEK